MWYCDVGVDAMTSAGTRIVMAGCLMIHAWIYEQ